MIHPELLFAPEQEGLQLLVPAEAMGLSAEFYRCYMCQQQFENDGHDSPHIFQGLEKLCNTCADYAYKYHGRYDSK